MNEREMQPPTERYPPSSLPHPLPTNRAPSSLLSTRSASGLDPLTPSMLTPNTRSEAEAALSANTAIQTDAAGPTTPTTPKDISDPAPTAAEEVVTTGPDSPVQRQLPSADQGGRRQSLGMRPPIPTRSSSNYINALEASGGGGDPAQHAAVEDAEEAAAATTGVDGPAGERRDGDATAEAVTEAVTETAGWRPKTDRKMSWSHQDMRRMMQESLMEKTREGDMGYDSATDDNR